MERSQLKMLGVGAIVGLAAGFLLARALYVGDVQKAQGMAVMGPSAPGAATNAPPMGATAPNAAAQQVRHEQIQQLIERAKANPKDREARVSLGNITFDNGLFDLAAKYYEEALALDSNDPLVLTDCGIAYGNLGDSQKAIAMFEKAVAQDPKHVKGWFNIAVVKFSNNKDVAGAREALKKALELDPNFKEAKDLQARLEASPP